MSRVREPRLMGKSFVIPKRLLSEGWLKVKENGGAAGADGVSIEQFEEDLSGEPVSAVESEVVGVVFPRAGPGSGDPQEGQEGRDQGARHTECRRSRRASSRGGGVGVQRGAGVPRGLLWLSSRALARGRGQGCAGERCFRKDWVVDLDIRAFFDSVPWKLMLKAVAHHTDQKWIVLYVERWLKAPMQKPDGTLIPRVKGTPQGSPISPCLANLFLHYGLDAWMPRGRSRGVQFERFADDAVIHCVSESQARQVRDAVARRLVEVGLELHPDKTRIVYCKDSNRRGNCEEISFTFCGYTFRPRKAYNKRTGKTFTGFLPAVAPEKLALMSRRVAGWRLHRRTTLDLEDLAAEVNLVLRGWFGYFTAFHQNAVIPLCQRIDRHLVRWARWKYKRLERSGRRAWAWLAGVRSRNPEMFVHWRYCSAPS